MQFEQQVFHAILWDCDGVLVDSERLCQQGWIDVLNQRGHAFLLRDFQQRFAGKTSGQVLQTLGLEPEAYPAIQQRIYDLFDRHLQPMSGVQEVLKRTQHMMHAVCSNASPKSLQLELQLTGLLDFFAGHIYSAHHTPKGKPAPDVYLLAAERLRVPSKHCLVIEDSVTGVQAGIAAGMMVWGFTGGSHCETGHAEMLRAAGASRVLKDFSEMLP